MVAPERLDELLARLEAWRGRRVRDEPSSTAGHRAGHDTKRRTILRRLAGP